MNNLHKLTAIEQIKKVEKKEITATELLQSHLDQIKREENDIRAWIYLNERAVFSQAAKIDELIKKGEFIGSLYGLPVGIKDVFNTIGMPTQMGSSLWKNFQPGNDARVVNKLRQEGAIFPGKTVTAEFSVHAPGPTNNPHRHGYMPGTSSSGSAAAVASFMVPLAFGTQTAGSTLRPASYCGIYGFKPTFGLLPRTGVLKTTDTLDHVGLLARSLEDIVLFFETLRVKGINYPFVFRKLKKRQKKVPKRWRVAFLKHPKWGEVEDYAKNAIEVFINNLAKKKKFQIKQVYLPILFNSVHEIHERIYDKCLAYYFQKEMKQPMLVSKAFSEMVERGKKITTTQYLEDLKIQEKITSELSSWFSDYDVLLTLTTAGEAMKGLNIVDRPDSCLIWTFCGVPAMSVPVFIGPTRLPFGLQVVAPKYHDYQLIEFVKEMLTFLV